MSIPIPLVRLPLSLWRHFGLISYWLLYLELTALIARKVGVKTGRVKLAKFKNGETNVALLDNVRYAE